MFEKITQFSQLPVFTGGKVEHALFVVFCIAIAFCIMLTVIMTVNYFIKGIVEIWKLRCEVKRRALDIKVQIEQELTKQTQITGQKPSSGF